MKEPNQFNSLVQFFNCSPNSPRLRSRNLFSITLIFLYVSLLPPMQAAVGDAPNGGTSISTGALSHQTTGHFNTALGLQALFSDTTGGNNTGAGVNVLYSNTNGSYNTANGLDALYANTSGNFNTATGDYALFHNTTGSQNTANGVNAIYYNTTGNYNTANGVGALYGNTTGSFNSVNGYQALYHNTGSFNTADGDQALYSNTSGDDNVAIGDSALITSTTGANNTAIGNQALAFNTTGSRNIALGELAGHNLTTGNSNIDIGATGVTGETNTIRIGEDLGDGPQTATYIAGINGVDEGGTISAVYINSDGRLGTAPPSSSRQFKKNIKPMDKVSEAILALKPVTFQYKSDNTATPQFGLVAEEVAEVNPELVLRDSEGKVYTVRYDAVNAMLLNEFLKEHRKVEELEKKLARQEADLTVRLKEQDAKIQKVAAEVELPQATRVVDTAQR